MRSADYVRELRRTMKELIRNSRQLRDKLYPSVAVYRIRSEEDYRAVIRYLFRPIPIELPYEYAAASLGYEITGMRCLNADLNLFLEGSSLCVARDPSNRTPRHLQQRGWRARKRRALFQGFASRGVSSSKFTSLTTSRTCANCRRRVGTHGVERTIMVPQSFRAFFACSGNREGYHIWAAKKQTRTLISHCSPMQLL
jgi:hypothetical protein